MIFVQSLTRMKPPPARAGGDWSPVRISSLMYTLPKIWELTTDERKSKFPLSFSLRSENIIGSVKLISLVSRKQLICCPKYYFTVYSAFYRLKDWQTFTDFLNKGNFICSSSAVCLFSLSCNLVLTKCQHSSSMLLEVWC